MKRRRYQIIAGLILLLVLVSVVLGNAIKAYVAQRSQSVFKAVLEEEGIVEVAP